MVLCPSEESQGISLVVIAGIKPAVPHGGDHRFLVGVALAGSVALDGADGDSLVGNLMMFTPGGDMSQKATVGVGGINTQVAANLLNEHGVQTTGHLLDLGQPLLEPQEAHATTLPAIIFKFDGATGDSLI